jgi:hypothetical protein
MSNKKALWTEQRQDRQPGRFTQVTAGLQYPKEQFMEERSLEYEQAIEAMHERIDQNIQAEVAEEAPAPDSARPVQLRVISDSPTGAPGAGAKVWLQFSAPVQLTGFTPERALILANDLRRRANLILHERHLAEARKRRER